MRKKPWIVLGIILATALPEMIFADYSSARAQPEGISLYLSLNRCLELAADNSRSIQAARKNVEIVAAAVAEAAGAFWPKLTYSIFADKAQEPIYPYSAAIYPGASSDDSGAAISLTEPLYSGGKLTGALGLAKTQFRIALEKERQTKQQLSFQVKQAFYRVWLAERMVKVAESSYDNMEHHVARIENSYKLGAVSRFEVLRAKVQRDSLKPKVIAAQNEQSLAKLSLALLMGFPKDRKYEVASDTEPFQVPAEIIQADIAADFPVEETIRTEQILESACQNRPEMRQMEQLKDLGQYQKQLAEAGYKPSIFMVGQYQGGSLDYNPGHWNGNKMWTLMLNITGNIFDGFTTSSKVTGAQKNVELTAIQESGLRDQIKLEVEEAAQNIRESLEVIHANQSNIHMAQESLEMTEGRFDQGLSTTMDIMDSQLALDQALSGYYQGIALYLTAQAKLDLVSGGN